MTKNDYIIIAKVFNEIKPQTLAENPTAINEGRQEIWGGLLIKLAQALHQDNNKFDKIKFFKACGAIVKN